MSLDSPTALSRLAQVNRRMVENAGWDVIHVGDIGMSSASDQQVLITRDKINVVCVMLDADFHALCLTSPEQCQGALRNPGFGKRA